MFLINPLGFKIIAAEITQIYKLLKRSAYDIPRKVR